MSQAREDAGVRLREALGGLVGVKPKMPVVDNFALSVIYTPGVAEPCKEIAKSKGLSYTYTWRGNAMALIGLGAPSLPRLESVALLLKVLAGVDAVPLAVEATDGGQVARVIRRLSPTFGAAWLVGVDPADAGQVIDALSDIDIPVLRPPRDEEHCLADPSVYPGLIRALLDLRVRQLDARLVVEAVHAGDEDELSFGSAPRVARAVAARAIGLGLGRSNITAEAVDGRLRGYLEAGRLAPFTEPEDWLEATSPREQALRLHARLAGAVEVEPKLAPADPRRLLAVTAGADAAAAALSEFPALADRLTGRGNLVAVVTDGTAVLGLGNIGAGAALPVMLGKSLLFKTFGGCDAVPVCIDTEDPGEIVETVEAIAPSFGGINLEDISAPRCFEIEDELRRRLDVFVFHDDQHGTAVVTLAGLVNAARLCGKTIGELTVTFNGAGAAGIAVTKLLLVAGVRDVILCDRAGPICEGRSENMNPAKAEIAGRTNRDRVRGTLADAVRGRDVFIGLSVGGALTGEMIRTMAKGPIIFAMANPVPEVMPSEARAAGAGAVATGRSDFPNQINNCLGFPGIFRGALDVAARSINDVMKISAAQAISALIDDKELRPGYFIPSAMDLRVPPAVAAAIARAAIETGEARVTADPEKVAARARRWLYEGRLE